MKRPAWLEVANDQWERARRIARFGLTSGLVAPDVARIDPTAARILLTNGIGVRTIHTIGAARHPDRLALVDEARAWTWKEVDLHINRVANEMVHRWGLGPRRAIVLCMENAAEYIVAWFAALRIGARCVHASFDATVDEAGWALDNSRAALVFCDAKGARGAGPAARARNLPIVAVGGPNAPVEGAVAIFEELLASRRVAFPEGLGRDVQADSVVYTSGTTGRPKGAVRDFAALGVDELARIGSRLPVREGERHLVVSRLYHSGAQAFVMLLSSLGATFHLQRRFDAAAVLDALSDEQIHSVFLVPTMIRRLVELPDRAWHAADLSSFRALVSGAAPFPQALRERAIGRLGPHRVFDFYGATELGWITVIDGFEMAAHPRSVGRALAGHVIRVVDGDGRALPAGEVGLIQVRSTTGMQEYLDNPDATRDAVADGWFTVEDTGRLSPDGYLTIEGRARDMILSGGMNLYPAEIEEALHVHEAVREAAVVGIPDEEWGERAVAVVALHEGHAFDEEALVAWLRTRLSSYKVPRSWLVVDELPRNPTGKVLKKELRTRLLAS